MRAALLPYSSAARVPAKPGIRLVAGVIDTMFTLWLELIALVAYGQTSDAIFISSRTLSSFAFWFASVAWAIAWFGLSETLFGTTLGKYLCGLRVATLGGQPPSGIAAFARAIIYNLGLLVMPLVAIRLYTAQHYHAAVATGELLATDWIVSTLWLVLFVTMRRRNGWATIHDLLTGTRVVALPREERDRAPRVEVPRETLTPTGEQVGVSVLRRSASLIEAYDANLRRPVWIIPAEAGAAMLSQARREVTRPTRLRWLQGTRTAEGGWDAYEAPAGVPLTRLLDGAQPWARVGPWLEDLAAEADAGRRDETLPGTAGLGSVWITEEGRAVLLEFPAPGAPPLETLPLLSASDAQLFLTSVADAALAPVKPQHASELLQTLREARLEDTALVAGNLRATLSEPASASPRRRLFSVGLWPAVSLVLSVVITAITLHAHRWFDRQWKERYPELPSLRRAVELTSSAVAEPYASGEFPSEAALKTHIAGYFRPAIEDDAFWQIPEVKSFFWPGAHKVQPDLAEIVTTRGPVSPEELSAADRKLARAFKEWQREDARFGRQVAYGMFTGCLAGGVLVSLAWTIFTGTPLGLRLCGFVLVRWKNGRRAGRIRAVLRHLAAWTPGCAALFGLGVAGLLEAPTVVLGMLVTACLATLAVSLLLPLRRPERGLADQLCGTAIVPR